MRYIFSYKANDWGPDDKIAPLTITFNQEVPEMEPGQGWQDFYRRSFAQAGRDLVDALYHHLPGGLVDAMFAELAWRKASLFHVAHEREEASTDDHG